MKRPILPPLRFLDLLCGRLGDRWNTDRVSMIRRIAVVLVAVLLTVGVWCSAASAGRMLRGYRVAAMIGSSQAVDDRSTNDRDAAEATTKADDGHGLSKTSKPSGTSERANDDAKTTDAQAADRAAMLAADAAAKPLSDREQSAILRKAESTAKAANDGADPVVYTYCLQTRGDVGNTTAFANIVFSTLNDPRGWPRAGVTFRPVAERDCDTADMDIILAAANTMSEFSPYCSPEYSCRVGQQVIINDDRWNNAVNAWLDAGGTFERYREMVINHEVGHRLGHIDNETTCAGAGQRAPLMQEQSMHLDGCVANEWPLDDELWIG